MTHRQYVTAPRRPITPKVRNAVASAMIADVTDRTLVTSHSAQTSRQTMVTQSVARALGLPFADVQMAVIETWQKVYSQPYAFSMGS